MATVISYPADPVTNGATTIQATTFNVVAADYVKVDYSAVQLFRKKAVVEGLPDFKSGLPTPDWQFIMRKDLVDASATYRNLIGVRTVQKVRAVTAFSGALGKVISANVETVRIEVYNWTPALVTLTDLTAFVVWTSNIATYTLIVDPETGTYLYGAGSHRSLQEAIGFILTQVAANPPTNGPAINAASGISPLG